MSVLQILIEPIIIPISTFITMFLPRAQKTNTTGTPAMAIKGKIRQPRFTSLGAANSYRLRHDRQKRLQDIEEKITNEKNTHIENFFAEKIPQLGSRHVNEASDQKELNTL